MSSIPCPHCKSVVPLILVTDGKCPNCGGDVRAGAESLPQPPKAVHQDSTPPEIRAMESVVQPTSRKRPSRSKRTWSEGAARVASNTVSTFVDRSSPGFSPRRYPALTFVMWVFYVLAALCVLSWLLSILMILSSPLGMMLDSRTSLREDAETFAFGVPFLLLFTTIVNGVGAALNLFMAEMIKLALHVQANTHETANLLRRYLPQRTEGE